MDTEKHARSGRWSAARLVAGLALVVVVALTLATSSGASPASGRAQVTTTTLPPTTTTTVAAATTTTEAATPQAETADELAATESGDDINYWVLLGVAVIVIGFLLKIDAIAVVIIAAAVTALVFGASFGQFLEVIGQSFVDNRNVSFFILTLPMIALSERFGLKEQAVILIKGMKKVTAPSFLFLYTIIRQVCGIFGIRISGMVQFVRPIVHPMTDAAAQEDGLIKSDADSEVIKAQSATAENVGNFFGQNGFIAASGVLLIVSTLQELPNGESVTPQAIAKASLPMIGIALVVAGIYFHLTARRLKGKAPVIGAAPEGAGDE